MTSWRCLPEYYGYNNYHTITAVLHFYLELERRQKPFNHHIFLKWFIICCMPWFENKKEHAMTIFTIYILRATGIGASSWALSVVTLQFSVDLLYPSIGLIKIFQNKTPERCRFGHKHTKMQPMLTGCLISFFRCGEKRF